MKHKRSLAGPGSFRALLMWAVTTVPLIVALPVAAQQQDEAPQPPPSVTESARQVDWAGAAQKTLEKNRDALPGNLKRRQGGRRPWFMDDELLARAGIGEDTVAAIRETIARTDAQRKASAAESGKQTGSAMRELVQLLMSDEFSEEKAREMLDAVLAERTELLRVQLEPKIQVRSLLTASQIAAIQAERPRFFMEPLTLPGNARKKNAPESAEEAPKEDVQESAGNDSDS